MKETIKMTGLVKLIEISIITGKKVVEEYENLVMLSPRTYLLDILGGDTTNASNLKIKGVSLGNTATAPLENNIKLGSEFFRKGLSSITVKDDTLTARTTIQATEGASQVIKEVGLFIHKDKGDGNGTWSVTTLNSGSLFSRIGNLNKDRTDNTKILVIEWTIKLLN